MVSHKRKETFENQEKVQFWTQDQTYNFIIEDNDQYIESMDEAVYSQRSTINRADYKRNSAGTAAAFSSKEMEALTTFANMVDAHLLKLDPKLERKMGPWIFALTKGSYYEMGEPHVRDGRIIFLSSDQLNEIIMDGCQMSLTLHYLRLEMLFPSQNKNKGLYVSHGAFPSNLSLPTCHSLV